MSINEEHRQVEVAAQVEELTRTLAHSTRTVPNPPDSYQLLGEVGATVDHLGQVCGQLAVWHGEPTTESRIFSGDDALVMLASASEAAVALAEAQQALHVASAALSRAHAANGAVRWVGNEERA